MTSSLTAEHELQDLAAKVGAQHFDRQGPTGDLEDKPATSEITLQDVVDKGDGHKLEEHTTDYDSQHTIPTTELNLQSVAGEFDEQPLGAQGIDYDSRCTTPKTQPDVQELVDKDEVLETEEQIINHDPKLWSSGRKWLVMGLVSWLCLVSPLASSMPAPATSLMNAEFDNDSHILSTFSVSFFILGYVVGSLIAAPLSDQFGRKLVLDITTAMFTIWQLACALAPDIEDLLIFRIFAGLAGSACLSIGGGIVSDLFESKDRGKATAIFALGPLLGPIIGPIIGGFLSQKAGWRWVYWFLFILGFLTLLLQIFGSSETNPHVILARQHAFEDKPRRWWHRLDWYGPVELSRADGQGPVKLSQAMLQPWKFVFTSPIIGLLCLYLGFVYGLLYLLLTTLTDVFVTIYGWSIGVSGLSYIGLGIGFLVGVAVVGSTSDRIMAKHARQNNNIAVPEVRLKACVYFSFLIPISFWWYGWSAENNAFWLAPITGLLCFGLGLIGIFLPIQTYMIDAFPEHAATTTAALASSRNVVGTFLPLAGPLLYDDMGLGWGNTILGFIALVLIPAPYYITKYGTKLRTRNHVEVDDE